MTLLAGLSRSPERAALSLILAFTVFHLILSVTVGLGVDEVYGISVARDLNLSYFDHPPMHYWVVHFFLPLLGDGRAARLPFVLMFTGTTWATYLLTRQLFGAAAGVWAILALNLSANFTLAGTWVLPDGPLMLSLAAAAYTISCGLFVQSEGSSPTPSPWRTWPVAALWIGTAALSKYHAVLFACGLLIYIVSMPQRRKLLLHPALWVGALIALLVASPVIIWNAENHWASIAFQSGRASVNGFPKIAQFFANIGGQLLWLLPWIFVPLVIAGYQALRQGREADRSWYCLCLALPSIVIFGIIPLWGDRGLPHWQMPGWLMLFPVLGNYLVHEAASRTRPRTWAITSAALLFTLISVIVVHSATGFGRVVFSSFRERDPTLEFLEWYPLGEELKSRGLLEQKGLFLITKDWIDVGKIDHALHGAFSIRVFGPFGEGRQYMFRYKGETFLGRDALILGREDRVEGIDSSLAEYFSSIQELPPFEFGRIGKNEVDVRMWYGRNLKKVLPLNQP